MRCVKSRGIAAELRQSVTASPAWCRTVRVAWSSRYEERDRVAVQLEETIVCLTAENRLGYKCHNPNTTQDKLEHKGAAGARQNPASTCMRYRQNVK